MRALSLWQPWASAIAHGTKRFETRHWPCPPGMLLVDVAIHAAKRRPRLDEIGDDFDEVCAQITGHEWGDLPLGSIVATARIGQVWRTEELFRADGSPTLFAAGIGVVEGRSMELEFMLGNYEAGRYAWSLHDVVKLNEPVPCVGRQGFWELDGESAFRVGQAKLGVRP